jgi:2-phospho-L-lactate/phosphoenolpyruvate guanylyltransferase
MTIHILIPLKQLTLAKQRLSPQVSAASRRRLMLCMLHRTILAARTAAVGPVALVTSESAASRALIPPGVGSSTTAASPGTKACNTLWRRSSPTAVLYLSADLPLITSADILEFVDSAPDPGVGVARARDGGTNALLVRPATGIAPLFGHQPSAARHARRAQDSGLVARIVDINGLSLDVDTVEDLRVARSERFHVSQPRAKA